MLKAENLSVIYPGSDKPALSNVDLSFEQGEFVCVLGQSGAGKSTLIRCMNGLQKATEGEMFWDGSPLSKIDDKQLRTVRKETGMIFQHFNLVPRLSVFQNVLTGLFGSRNNFRNAFGLFSDEEKEMARQVIGNVGLENEIGRRVENLSGGQKQRVGIARALLQQPKVFLGDEPVASLDPGTAAHIFNLLQEIHFSHNLLTIINVHDVNLAKHYATRVLALKEGKVIFDGKPEEFTDEYYHLTYNSAQKKQQFSVVSKR
ncbi:phosphonate ABC transporter ATP-binding protein [Pseudalkalibacillus caeni]|uniref:Phosphonate ABC transporter ATP-binding protein n=1 Tax=Exobacillus caeni TaxID=2574798 RepID=A0A5R9F4C9_9BACL|nr:phosphonate ABC transporter ATP-binding protein [Pseudalkalibacillus caeni]TLS35344.1 phosphonate ABC transporter ATP-binding protein [Pseudalkalibacillus caeni]